MQRRFSIGRREIGAGQPCYVIAEAGSNHNGDLEKAYSLIELAADAQADAVKFQVFRASRMYPRSAGTSDYLKTSTPIYEIIERMEMPYEWLPLLRERCRRAGIDFLATPFDEQSADRLDPFVEAFKIASYELTHLPLVEHVARKGKPVIMSTGTATLDEIAESVAAIERTGNGALALMQCTAAYPAAIDAINIRALDAIAARFDVPVGLSDHSRDPLVAPIAAVARGAAIIEKHFTLSNDLPGPDHRFAVEPEELRQMVRAIRDAERALGSGVKGVDPSEAELRAFARRDLFATRPIAPGDVFSPENVAVLRRGKCAPGLAPDQWPNVIGRRAARAVAPDTALQADDIA